MPSHARNVATPRKRSKPAVAARSKPKKAETKVPRTATAQRLEPVGELERPLSAEEQKLIRLYCRPDVRDLKAAAKMLGKTAKWAEGVYQRPAVRADIDLRLGLLKQEQAALDAKQEALPDSLIEAELANVVRLDGTAHGATKLAGLRLALVVKGRIETRQEKAVGLASQPSAFRPAIYGSIAPGGRSAAAVTSLTPGASTTTLRRTEELIQTQAPELPQAPQAPPYAFEVIER